MDDIDRAILCFEADHPVWKYPGSREAAIRETFGLSPTAYAQRMVRILDDPAAHSVDPATVTRLRRLRDQRGRHRKLRSGPRPI